MSIPQNLLKSLKQNCYFMQCFTTFKIHRAPTTKQKKICHIWKLKTTFNVNIEFIWSRNGAIKTKAFVKGLLEPKLNIVGGAVFTDPPIAYITAVNVMLCSV